MSSLELDESQRRALDMMLCEPLCIVTGGPGTGKTTILRAALDLLESHTTVALAAPTGKAAKRMAEATGREASTIHRLLGYNPETRGFFHGADNPLPHGLIVVDEASMVDVELFADLIEAVDPAVSRLILVGDAHQLPSVGPGSILADLVRADLVPCVRLSTVHRSAAESWVCRSAPRVLDGLALDLSPREDFRFWAVAQGADVPAACVSVVERYGADTQILVPQRTGAAGAEAINALMQERVNPLRAGEHAWRGSPHELRPRDRVIHVRNNYQLGVFNGETGVVASVADDALSVDYDDRAELVRYSRKDGLDLRLAYALTIHKSQGSEWPWVGVVVHSTHTFMLTRQLVYTAITRAKTGVVLIGDRKGIDAALRSKRGTRRNTALTERIRGELGELDDDEEATKP